MNNNVKVVKQNDLRDCGVACLLSIIRFYGGNVPLETLRIDTHTTKDGTTAFNLIDAAQKYGLDGSGYKLSKDDLSSTKIIYPVIAHVIENKMPHFLVIYQIKKNKVLVMDPAFGKKEIKLNDFLIKWTGYVLCFYPKGEISYFKSDNKLPKLFRDFLKKEKKLIGQILLSSLILTILEIISSYYFKLGIDSLDNNLTLVYLKQLVYIFAFVIAFKCLFKYLRSYYETYLNKNIDLYLIEDFLNHLFHLPSKVIQSRTSGEIMTRINELNNVKNLFTDIFVTFFLDFVLTLITLPILYNISELLFRILCLCLLLYFILGYFFSKIIYRRVMQNINYEDNFNTVLLENINCFNSIKNLNSTSKVLEKIEYKVSQYIYDNFTFSKLLNNQNSCKDFINEFCYFLINSFGFLLIFENKLSLTNLLLFNSLMVFFLEPIKNLINSLPKYNFLKASYYKISEFMNIEDDQSSQKEITITNYNLTIKNLSFSYNSYENIIENYNMEIKANEHIMLSGPSGCGKSTICRILSGEEKNMKGTILIGNNNYLDLNQVTIKNNIMYVSQKEYLYSDTIKSNILFYRNISEEDLLKICEACYINEIVAKRPMRYETMISMDSSNLSGGEKQRIVLARACLNNFKILILDEALSEVDMDLEEKIIKNLRKIFKDKTIIYVSHKKQDKLFDRTINVEDKNAELC